MFDAISLPFGANELLETGSQLLVLVGPIVLLTLAFYMAGNLIDLVKKANSGGSKSESTPRRRRNFETVVDMDSSGRKRIVYKHPY